MCVLVHIADFFPSFVPDLFVNTLRWTSTNDPTELGFNIYPDVKPKADAVRAWLLLPGVCSFKVNRLDTKYSKHFNDRNSCTKVSKHNELGKVVSAGAEWVRAL